MEINRRRKIPGLDSTTRYRFLYFRTTKQRFSGAQSTSDHPIKKQSRSCKARFKPGFFIVQNNRQSAQSDSDGSIHIADDSYFIHGNLDESIQKLRMLTFFQSSDFKALETIGNQR